MTERALVLNVFQFDFVNKETGEKVSGTKLSYVGVHESGGEGRRGLEVVNIGGTYEAGEPFVEVPGVYDLELILRPSSKGNTGKLIGGTLIRPVDLPQVLVQVS